MAVSKLELIEKDRGQPIREILADLFRKYGSQRAVAQELGVTQGTVSLWLIRLGLEVKTVLVEKAVAVQEVNGQ